MPHVRVPRDVTQLVVDYFDYAARPVASARRAARRVAHRRLLRLAQARHQLLRLRCASCCFDFKVRHVWQLKLTSVFKLHFKVCSARHKVDFGF
jgi:cell division FtsZ-interacting protein ZapD